MTQEERDWLHWLKQAQEKKMTQKQAAQKMKVTPRWVRTLVKKLKRQGDGVLVHGLRGRSSNRKIPDKTQKQVMTIVRREYADFGPTLASEYLAEKHSIPERRPWASKGEDRRAGPPYFICLYRNGHIRPAFFSAARI